MQEFRRDRLQVQIHSSRTEAGRAAGGAAAEEIRSMLSARTEAAIILASAASQVEFLEALRTEPGIDWPRVAVLHLDEYAGLPEDHPASFRRFLRDHFVSRLPVREFHGLNGSAADLEAECVRYAALLEREKPGLVALGIGENGHLAFIDPHLCDFRDSRLVRVVDLDDTCRMQQVHDGAFPRVEEVPRHALSLTVPAMLRVPRAVVTVPGPTKRDAVKRALEGPVAEECPASALRGHSRATLYLDADSAALLAR